MITWVEIELLNLTCGYNSIKKKVSKMSDGFRVLLIGIFDKKLDILLSGFEVSVSDDEFKLLLIEMINHFCPVPLLDVIPGNVLDVPDEALSFASEDARIGDFLVHEFKLSKL